TNPAGANRQLLGVADRHYQETIAEALIGLGSERALVAAAAGCAVAKHGNRSSTSKCGSADLLEALGVDIELEPAQVGRCIDEVGFGFMFAPRHHKAMAHVVPVRKELAVRTIFNFLGPLTNPAGAQRQLLGVSDRHYQETIAEALVGLGSERAMVVTAEDGVDELSISARTRVIEVRDGGTEEHFVEPGDFGFAMAELGDVEGGTPEENAAASRAVLAGETGPRRDLVLLNAGAAIYVGGRVESLAEGVELAAATIDSGAGGEMLERLVAATTAPSV
ncbi:MAG TPA: anthranilate phosphoribosyltransferase, partial [Solirubrobacterales bacterium]